MIAPSFPRNGGFPPSLRIAILSFSGPLTPMNFIVIRAPGGGGGGPDGGGGATGCTCWIAAGGGGGGAAFTLNRNRLRAADSGFVRSAFSASRCTLGGAVRGGGGRRAGGFPAGGAVVPAGLDVGACGADVAAVPGHI